MNINLETLKKTERLTYTLRRLYEQYGFGMFSMNKMEEYALYVENMNFLKSREIIAFTDLDGRLMALKPDITLSIAKSVNGDPGGLEKLYYTENVFRASSRAREYRELRQMGLECIGKLTPYAITEVLSLAQKTLREVDEDYYLDVSHLGFVAGLFESLGVGPQEREKLVDLVREKNTHDLKKEAAKRGMKEAEAEKLCALVGLSGQFGATLEAAEALCANTEMESAVKELRTLCAGLDQSRLRLDFSIVSDLQYYNGVVFQGFVRPIPDAVLSGGQYDNLLIKMGKKGKSAIGFALYLDEIERAYRNPPPKAADVSVLYDEGNPPQEVLAMVERLVEKGLTVTAVTEPSAIQGDVFDIRSKKDA